MANPCDAPSIFERHRHMPRAEKGLAEPMPGRRCLPEMADELRWPICCWLPPSNGKKQNDGPVAQYLNRKYCGKKSLAGSHSWPASDFSGGVVK